MHIYRYRADGQVWYGELNDQGRLARHLKLSADKFELKRAGMEEDEIGAVELLVPCTPSKVICVGRNYREHAKELGNIPPADLGADARPLLFFKPPSCLIPHGAPIRLPGEALGGPTRIDFEGEIALVINRRCKDIPEAEAYDVLLGVTAFNDVTARDWQKSDGQWARAKGMDTFGPCGPYIDTTVAEALRSGAQLQKSFIAQTGNSAVNAEAQLPLSVKTLVNGELKQECHVRELSYSLAYLISYISSLFTLEAGDLIVTGTPAGVGPLASGDEVVVELSCGIKLSNPVE
ncbi:fumarylacetoacetate hydrolase family protein [bacterium]|nr:fumarylacetoacetate hydrolase family protein [bacterium]